MSNMEQLKANIHTYEEEKPLNEEEMKTLLGVADSMLEKKDAAVHCMPLLREPLPAGA